MRTRFLQRLESYIFQQRSADVETAMMITIPVGGFIGVMSGLRQAEKHQDGYLWRTIAYGAFGLSSGIFGGVHYRKLMFLMISGDLFNSWIRSFKY